WPGAQAPAARKTGGGSAAQQLPGPASLNIDITPLPSPAAPPSAQPQLHSSRRGVILSWIEPDGPTATLKFAERTAEGWSEPRVVASGNNWFVNWADVPSVV